MKEAEPAEAAKEAALPETVTEQVESEESAESAGTVQLEADPVISETATVELTKKAESTKEPDESPADDEPKPAAAEADSDAAEGDSDAAADDGTPSRRSWILAAAALVLSVALVSATVWMTVQRNNIADQQAMGADYVQAAKQAMLNITNISADTAPDDINRVLAVTSGDLKNEYTTRKDDYAAIVKKAQVNAKGEIIEAALQSSDEHSAIVLVAVKQIVTNVGAEGQQQRQYRFKVTIARGDNGFTATSMEMVV
ncbi:hypothetical protein [Nocardia sp. XZ_19_385]|uniref:hypothetical protein n=1 Tax=Nocardia sp. XZ_19_385 TaxID=2769488 RepID=UPI00188F4FAD|nr:hypothetical protein [Nocardia sp. XZ_19_385]